MPGIRNFFSGFILICSIFLIFVSKNYAEEMLWAGANQYQLWFQRTERIEQQLNAMQQAGLKVLRIFLGERSDYQSWEDPPEAYTFEKTIGTYHEGNLKKVDYLMAECLKRNIKLIIALAGCSDIYQRTYGQKSMYTSPAALTAYQNRFKYFLNHQNSYLGKAWKDCDEVVYAWEIQNEPGIPLINYRGLTSVERHTIIREFLKNLAKYLKTLDPNTKVSLGIAGYANYYHDGKSGDDIRTLGNIESADIYTLHFYGGDVNQWINDNLAYCRSIKKLLFVEEFGYERKEGMTRIINLYRSVAQTCRKQGVPWMFWRLGHRKDDNTWSINSDDAVWQQVVIPEAKLINQIRTTDPWGVNIVSSIRAEFPEIVDTPKLGCFPNPFNSNIHFTLQTSEPRVEIKIFDLQGRMVFHDSVYPAHNLIDYQWQGGTTDGMMMSSGLYLVIFDDKKQLYSARICYIK
ncbi:cellulase family glycosylhydrolase [candidate division KSB1 bacterium]|nr:cellulase family glycosylhydrolase [candidate division KSB1 bacterium]